MRFWRLYSQYQTIPEFKEDEGDFELNGSEFGTYSEDENMQDFLDVDEDAR